MFKRVLEVVGDALIMVFGGLSLFMFIGIAQHGISSFIEPNSWILYAEIFLSAMVVVIGIERGYDDLANKKAQATVAEGGGNMAEKIAVKWRPQILVAISILGMVAIIGMFVGAVEVATGCTGGVIALGMKLLEGE